MLREIPIFGICGNSGSGKTTLIEMLVPRLRERGFSVAVAKFHASHIRIDTPGKDSDRLFETGADVTLHGREQGFTRTHATADEESVRRLAEFARRYDLVLLEGRKPIDCEKVWLLAEGETSAPEEAGEIIAKVARNADRTETVWKILDEWLAAQWLRTPVYGCVLIGGASTRMGRPKHLIETDGRTWVERACAAMRELTERVAVVGAGELPEGLTEVVRLPDVTDATGPVSGILSAMRWAPGASWLVSACDLPNVSTEALRWLLSTRAPGVWATIPKLAGRENVEPLLAHYDFRARTLIDRMLTTGHAGPSRLAREEKVITPAPPVEIASAWENVNTPEDLSRAAPKKGV